MEECRSIRRRRRRIGVEDTVSIHEWNFTVVHHLDTNTNILVDVATVSFFKIR